MPRRLVSSRTKARTSGSSEMTSATMSSAPASASSTCSTPFSGSTNLAANSSAEELAARFVGPEKGVEQVEDALAGALDIVAEVISDDPDVRAFVRELTSRRGMLSVEQAKDADPEIAREYE